MLKTFVKAIGEISIRVHDMDGMLEFYVNKLGFELRRRFEGDVAAIKLAEGVAGQVQTLTLFGAHLGGNFNEYKWQGLSNQQSPLHHFALTIACEEYEDFIKVLEQNDIAYNVANHRWTGWKGIYIQDPEENIIEFVCYDANFDESLTGQYDFNKLHGASSGKKFV